MYPGILGLVRAGASHYWLGFQVCTLDTVIYTTLFQIMKYSLGRPKHRE